MSNKMKITPVKIKIRDLTEGFEDNAENGVQAYSGKLDIRPPYQREFVYNDKQRAKVIDTVIKGFPLNTMYWAKRKDGTFEIIDGQQRTLSICQYVNNEFSVNYKTFKALQESEKNAVLDYELTVYICEGDDKEKLDWFETINIAGAELTKQEMRNAVYSGPWVTDAKRYFSKTNCAAFNIGSKYVNGELNRQAYLETAIKWISGAKTDGEIRDYMANHCDEQNAEPLFENFRFVIEWVKKIFPTYRKQMKGIDWGYLYRTYSNKEYDAEEFEKEISKLMEDKDEVQNQSGIYFYVFDHERKHLNLRQFSDFQKTIMYERQQGICPMCKGTENENKKWDFSEMEGDHIIPWSKGGKTTLENGQMLCRKHNSEKSDKY